MDRCWGGDIKCPLQLFLKPRSVPLFLTFQLFILVGIICKKKKMCLGHLVLLTELSDIFRGVKIPEKLGGDIALGLFSFVLQFPTIFGKPKYN